MTNSDRRMNNVRNILNAVTITLYMIYCNNNYYYTPNKITISQNKIIILCRAYVFTRRGQLTDSYLTRFDFRRNKKLI